MAGEEEKQTYSTHGDVDDSLTVPIILNTIQKLNENKSIIYYYGKTIDYTFLMMEKCTDLEISKLEKSIGYALLSDYRQFLSITNGLHLSNLAVSLLYDIKSIYETREIYCDMIDDFPKNMLAIGQFFDGTVQAMIKLDAGEDKCMYVHDLYEGGLPVSLKCSFTEFLDRFVATYGLNFWEWGSG